MKAGINIVLRLLNQADKYPLHVRIAAKLHLAGVTEETFFGLEMPTAPHSMRLRVGNTLHDIEFGVTKLTTELIELAGQL